VTAVLRYVPKAMKVEDPSSELQGNVLGDLTLPIKQIDAISCVDTQFFPMYFYKEYFQNNMYMHI